MPGAVPRTSTYALTNVTIPYALEIANRGLEDAIRARPRARAGGERLRGARDERGRRGAHGLPSTPLDSLVDGLG